MTDRLKKLKAAQTGQAAALTAHHRAPAMPANAIDEKESANMDAQLAFSKLTSHLVKADIGLEHFLRDVAGIKITKHAREINTPFGERYQVACSHLTYNDLLTKCIIDKDNVRDDSERQTEVLGDLLDEIKAGFQFTPAIGYLDENEKISLVDGSRRFACAMLGNVGLDVEIFDRKPPPEVIQWLVEASDRKKNFSDLSLGRLYCGLMASHGWSAKQLAENKKIAEATVSYCVNFYKAPDELKRLLPLTTTKRRQTIAFVTATHFIVERKLIDKAVAFVHAATEKQFDSLDAKKIAVIDSLSLFVKEAKRQKIETINKRTKVKLYESGQTSIVLEKNNRSATIKLNRLLKEKEEEIITLIENYIKTSQLK